MEETSPQETQETPDVSQLLADLLKPQAEVALGSMASLMEQEVPREELLSALGRAAHRHADSKVRIQATEHLCGLGGDAVPHLLKVRQSRIPEVRTKAKDTIEALGIEALPGLIVAAKDSGHQIRQMAVSAIGKLGEAAASAVPTILEIMGDANESLQTTCVAALVRIGEKTEELADTLIERLKSDTIDVRASAANAIGRLGVKSPTIIQELIRSLSLNIWSDKLKDSVYKAIEKLGEKPMDHILAALDDQELRAGAVAFLDHHELSGKIPVDLLLELMEHENSTTRQRAVNALTNHSPKTPEIVTKLLHTMADDDTEVGRQAANAVEYLDPLEYIEEETEALLKSLTKALTIYNWKTRMVAAICLRKMGEKASSTRENIQKAIFDDDSDVRREALKALPEIGPLTKDDLPTLIRSLKEHYGTPLHLAAEYVGRIGPEAAEAGPEALDEMKRILLNYEDSELRNILCTAIPKLGVAALPMLLEATQSDKTEVEETASKALQNFDEDAIPMLFDIVVQKSDRFLRWEAMRAIENIGNLDDKMRPLLKLTIQDDDPKIRSGAAILLGNFSPLDQEGVELLTEALDDEDWEVRLESLYTLKDQGIMANKATPKIRGLLEDPVEEVRCAALETLPKIYPSTDEHFPIYEKALEDDSWMVRAIAAQNAASLGKDNAKDLIPRLKHLLEQDPFELVRTHSKETLTSLGEIVEVKPKPEATASDVPKGLTMDDLIASIKSQLGET